MKSQVCVLLEDKQKTRTKIEKLKIRDLSKSAIKKFPLCITYTMIMNSAQFPREFLLGLLLMLLSLRSIQCLPNLVQNPGAEQGVAYWSNGAWDACGTPHSGSAAFCTGCGSSCAPLSQTISGMMIGEPYVFSFYLCGTRGGGYCSSITIGSITLLSSFGLSGSYTFYSTTFTADSSSAVLSFTCGNPPGFNYLDDISLTALHATPTSQPTSVPSKQPATSPSRQPTARPSSQPVSTPSSQPFSKPSNQPSSQPSLQPSGQPSHSPSRKPTSIPSRQPSSEPSEQPSARPSSQPSSFPSSQPTAKPSLQPSSQPSSIPSTQPTGQPSLQPTRQPSSKPSTQPSNWPSEQPTTVPSSLPTTQPSRQPTVIPSVQPTSQPSGFPSSQPTSIPSTQPTAVPSGQPSSCPSSQPSSVPSTQPSALPTTQPSSQPTSQPSGFPSTQPTAVPSSQPSSFPSSQPSSVPSSEPSALPSSQPSSIPSSQPSNVPTGQPTSVPSSQPSALPTSQPSSLPSGQPSSQPTSQPSGFPSAQPTSFPSSQPSSLPTNQPSAVPSSQPTSQPSSSPSSQPTGFPSSQPSTVPSSQPTTGPTGQPSVQPSGQPSAFPSNQPTTVPSSQPLSRPSTQPSARPSGQPSSLPSAQPTAFPSTQPSGIPTNQPTCFPTSQPSSFPSSQPTVVPSTQPLSVPSTQPTSSPTAQPSSSPSSKPSSQPSQSPSKQPNSFPTSSPSMQPTVIPSAQPFSLPTSAPQATIFQTNGVLFYLGVTTGINRTHNNNDFLGTSYILFGRNFKHQSKFPFTISLDSSSSREFLSEISSNEAGIRNDLTIRSTTIIGDINGDGFLDLLVGYPLASKCSVYLGDGVNDFGTIISTTGESFDIFGDVYQGGGFLGWSSIRIGDLNGDGFDEIVVSAIYANTIYVIYGRTHFEKTININELTKKDGFQIQGSNEETNFGVGLTLLHSFRKGSHADIAVTAQRPSGGQCVVYVLFGGFLFENPESIIAIDRIMLNPSALLKIITPLYSFAGYAVAGVGDINSDGYDDLAVGSVPYNHGKFQKQNTYIIYGKKFDGEVELDLTLMTSEDGFIISGCGFMVTGVGDVNADNVADVMITSYYDWNGQSSAYLIKTPGNMTYTPSQQPSSTPTRIPTFYPTSATKIGNFTEDGSSSGSPATEKKTPVRPSSAPTQTKATTQINATRAPTRPVFAVGTSRPSSGKPSLVPSLTPSSGYHRLRGFPTVAPARTPTMLPTVYNTTIFTEVDCLNDKECRGTNGTDYLFRITSISGTVQLTGNDEGGAKNLYVLYCSSEPVDVVIQNFRVSTDIISVVLLTKAGSSYRSLNDISYSKSNPLTLLFCTGNKLQVELPSHAEFDLQANNFLFLPDNDNGSEQKSKKNTINQIVIVFAVLFFLLAVFFGLSYQNNQKNKKESKHEEQWSELLEIPSERLPTPPDCCCEYDREKHEIADASIASVPTFVANINIKEEKLENSPQRSISDLASGSSSSLESLFQRGSVSPYHPASNEDIASLNTDEWENALALSDDSKEADRIIQLQPAVAEAPSSVPFEEKCQNDTPSHDSSSSSSNSSSEERSQPTSDISALINSMVEEEDEKEENDKDGEIDTNLIDEWDEWRGALESSDDGES
jgi:preprotein translocase subunit SecG